MAPARGDFDDRFGGGNRHPCYEVAARGAVPRNAELPEPVRTAARDLAAAQGAEVRIDRPFGVDERVHARARERSRLWAADLVAADFTPAHQPLEAGANLRPSDPKARRFGNVVPASHAAIEAQQAAL